MAEGEKTIKVVDRRLFTADGELREEAKAEMERAARRAGGPAPVPAEQPRLPGAPARDATGLPPPPGHARPDGGALHGGLPDPSTGRRQVDMAGARQIIDSLMALREKTRGRLSFQETDALESLLGELQLVFARLAAPPGRSRRRLLPVRRG